MVEYENDEIIFQGGGYMAVLVNKTQKNFTMISNSILRDKELSLKDRGLLCTICSLPDQWDFSIAGLSAIIPDGKDAIAKAIKRLEKLGYLVRTMSRNHLGKFVSEIEVFTERRSAADLPERETRHGITDAESPVRDNRDGSSETDKLLEYNTDHEKQKNKKDHIISISQEDGEQADGLTDEERTVQQYKDLIAENIHLDWLLEAARQKSDTEVQMVHEIYDVICDMVCYPHEKVFIRNTEYPWSTVKARFLKLTHDHVADVLDRVIDKDLEIKHMVPYLVSTLYMTSLAKTMEVQSSIHDDYLKSLRGKPYSIS